MADFQWPWHYNFPPFFTLQLHSDVRKIQLDAWCSLIISWGRHNKISQIDIAEAPGLPIFCNSAINRSLPIDAIKAILDELLSRGNLEWVDKYKKQAYLYWRSPSEWAHQIYTWVKDRVKAYLYWRSPSEWAHQIYTWVKDTSKLNAVCTLYEITRGDDTVDEEFHDLDDMLLLKALKHLEASGKAELINIEGCAGVKFL